MTPFLTKMIYIKIPSETDLTILEDNGIDYDIWNAEELVAKKGECPMEIGFEAKGLLEKAKNLLGMNLSPPHQS